jgi:MFS family permease
MTIVIGIISPFLIYDSIERSKWLDEDEKRYLRTRLTMDRQGRVKGKFKKLYLMQALKDYKIYACSMIYFADAVGTYGLSFALPTIIKQLGYTSAVAQLLTIPTYLFASLFTLVCAWFADKSRKRVKFILISYLTAIAGLVICLATPQPRLPGLILFAVYLIAAGVYSVVPSVVSLVQSLLVMAIAYSVYLF